MDDKITVINDQGEQIECDVLTAFSVGDTNRAYVVYTDNTRTETGELRVYASVCNPDGEDRTLYPVESEEEWEMIEAVLHELAENPDKYEVDEDDDCDEDTMTLSDLFEAFDLPTDTP